MSGFAKRYQLPPAIADGMARGVADRIGARDPLGALLYARLCWDWADAVPYRGVAALAESVGIGTTYLQTVSRRLEEAGLVVIGRGAGRQIGYEIQLPVLNRAPTDENDAQVNCYETGGTSGLPSYEYGRGSQVVSTPLSALVGNVNESGVSAGYVTLCEFGTKLAKYIYCSYNCFDTASCLDTATANTTAVTTTSKHKQQLPASQNSKSEQGVPGGTGGQGSPDALGTKPEKGSRKLRSNRARGSAGFRAATKDEVKADEHYDVIAALHADWCTALGVTLTLSNWRYAAWRGAIVEAGYTPEQLRSAFPAVAADNWWRERPDPHYMFGSNPDKIERFFPVNVSTAAPDRFAQRPQVTPEPFEF